MTASDLNTNTILDFLSESWGDMSIEEWLHWLDLVPRLTFSPQDKHHLCEILLEASTGIMYAQEGAYYDDPDEITRFCLKLALVVHAAYITAPTKNGVSALLQQNSKAAAISIAGADPMHRASTIDKALAALINQSKSLAA